MNARKLLVPSLAVCATLALLLKLSAKGAAAKPVSDRAPDDASFEEIDAYVEQQMRRLNVPGAALVVVEGDEIVHQRGFGQARPGGEAPTPQTPFLLGSLTKSFTAMAVMQLAEAGRIDLDAPAQAYLPWFRVADPAASAQITVRHLLNQTSGLPGLPGMTNLADFDDRPGAVGRQVRALSTLELTRQPGAAYEYSNLNYNVLGLIVEAASGEPYADYVQGHIFDPLGMAHSHTSQAAARADGLAVGHRYWFAAPVAEPDLPMPQGSLPSGQLIASPEDMGRYLSAYLSGGRSGGAQVLSPEGIAEMHHPAAEAVTMGVSTGHYAMGWFVEQYDESTVIWHSGTVPDFFAFMALLPDQNRGMALLVNANHVMLDKLNFTEMGMNVARRLAGQTPPPSQFGVVPWALRALTLIPLVQAAGAAFTLGRLRRWRDDPASRPDGVRRWGLAVLLPLAGNLAWAAAPLYLISSGLLGFMRLFMPDLTWLALIGGGFSLVWGVVRTWLVVRALGDTRADVRRGVVWGA